MRSGSGVGRTSMGAMSKEERFHMAVRAPGSGGGISRLYGPGSSQRQQLRSASALKKPPEPLRRAVADCLSSSAPHVHGTAPALFSEAGRTLRDYLAAPTTTDMAYGVILGHTLAERERSPAVVSRCVDLLKRYLIRYVPKVQTLRQIDEFCANSIAECNYVCNRGNSLGHRTGVTSSSGSTVRPSVVASNYASTSLVKSLNYVRSLVVRHIPKLSFQPVALNPASNTLSSLLSRSMSSDLSPKIVSSKVASEAEVVSSPFALDPSRVEKAGVGNDKYISDNLLKWRWHGDKDDLLSARNESATVMRPQDVQEHCFLEVGAAALFVGDLESKTQDQIWKHSSADLPGSDQLLHPSAVTTANSFPFADNHLKAITASKRVKPGPHQVWMNIPVSTFHPRARTLFQYRYYSEQQPLRLNPAEVSDVIAAVCFECSPNPNPMLTSLKFSNPGGKPSTEVAVSVLVKLVIDMVLINKLSHENEDVEASHLWERYMMDPGMAAALTLFMLEDMLSSSKLSSRVRVFDVIANLGVHAHLLEPMFTENPSMVEEKTSQDVYLTHEGPNNSAESSNQKTVASAIENFESWLLVILYEILPLLVQKEESEEIVWASALSCLLYFICDRGKIWRNRLEGLDIRVVKAFLDISRENSWSEIVHRKLVSILANMFYRVSEPSNTHVDPKEFLAEQVDLLGGIDFVCLEYARANMREEKQDLFVVLLDYAVNQINEVSLASGGSKHSSNDIQPVATMLMLADAPEAFYVAVKHGVDGVGDILKRSVSFTLSRSSNVEHLSLLLEEITGKLDATISSFTRLDDEFSSMLQVTNSSKYMNSVEDLESENGSKIKLSWTTLHSLLYSERSVYRHNGYIWLVELLISGITEEGDLCSNIKNLQQQIVLACSQDYCFSVPIPVSIFCGLLKSKYSYVRWGFLFVLEKLLMHCKLLLDENKMHYSSEEAIESEKEECRLEKANAVVDIMSCGLALLVQINETNRINILKMCDMLFSQLSLRLLPASKMPHSDFRGNENIFGYANKGISSAELHVFKHKIGRSEDFFLGGPSDMRDRHPYPHVHESASMAALLLRGCATVPMQLVARVPIPVLYWPLIQLAGAATDDISLGVAVGSRGRGNLPGASSDIRAALLLLLNCKCTADPNAFFEVGGKDFFRELLDDTDSRVAYYSSAFLLKRMMTDEPEKYQRLLQNLIFKAQQSNNEKLLENPYLQMRGILQLLNDLGADL